MGKLTKPLLDELLDAGCNSCNATRLIFSTYVDARLPLLAGEPVGALGWAYDGEAFLDGVYEVACGSCKEIVFSDSDCPRCHGQGGLARALAATNTFEVLTACPRCGGQELRYQAMVPARVACVGKRTEKARSSVELLDRGFHGAGAECRECGVVAELPHDQCPLCDAKGPLRARA